MKPLLRRVSLPASAPLRLTWNGLALQAHEGDTVLTALLLAAQQLRVTLGEGAPRAGFCLMGACQDCWVVLERGERLRACSTALTTGMSILTRRARAA